jgi:hypothetical protein
MQASQSRDFGEVFLFFLSGVLRPAFPTDEQELFCTTREKRGMVFSLRSPAQYYFPNNALNRQTAHLFSQ